MTPGIDEVHTDGMFVDPEDPEKEKKIRDAEGKFVSKKTDPVDTAKKTVEVSGPITVVREAIKDPSIDKPLVSVQINNPFRKLFLWIKEIKNKQTTTFEFKIKIPLIALPVFLVVLGSAFTFFFNLGKDAQKQSEAPAVVVPTPIATKAAILTSKVGTIKGTYQVLGLMAQALETSTPTPSGQTVNPTTAPTSTPSPTPTNTPTPTPLPSRYVLLDKDEKIIFLVVPSAIRMDKYIDKRVLVTGLYDEEKRTLDVKKASDIEVLP